MKTKTFNPNIFVSFLERFLAVDDVFVESYLLVSCSSLSSTLAELDSFRSFLTFAEDFANSNLSSSSSFE